MEKPEQSKYKTLPIWGFVVVAAVYLAIIHFATKFFTQGLDIKYAAPTSVEEVVRGFLLPIGVSLLFVYAVVAYLGWWKPVLKDDKPVRKWVRSIPIVMIIAILLGTNYSGLADKGIVFIVLLLTTTMFVGFAEEGMFRGIGVTAFRMKGFSEGKVALYTSLLFGMGHAINIFTEGPSAFLQVITTAIAGYYFYLIRRHYGGLTGSALLHGFWDFALISGSIVADEKYIGGLAPLLADFVILVLILFHIRKIEPAASAPAKTAAATTKQPV